MVQELVPHCIPLVEGKREEYALSFKLCWLHVENIQVLTIPNFQKGWMLCCAQQVRPLLTSPYCFRNWKKIFVIRYDLAKTCLMFTMCLLNAFARLVISSVLAWNKSLGEFSKLLKCIWSLKNCLARMRTWIWFSKPTFKNWGAGFTFLILTFSWE